MLGRMDTSTAAITYYPSSLTCLGYNAFDWSVEGSSIDANDNIWVAMHYNGVSGYTKLVQFDSSGALLSTYDPSTATRNWTDFTTGPDGNLWIADSRNDQITKLTLSTVTHAVVGSTNYAISGNPHGITAGPDGNLWFVEDDSTIGKITTGGTVTYYTVTSGRKPQRFTTGSDGALWFTALRSSGATTDAIGRITTSGAVVEYEIPTSNADPWGITSGVDGALWFTEAASNKIGRLGY